MERKKIISAAAYARFSSDNQREESIDAQLNIIKDFAANNGYEIVRTYTDEAKSARTDNRPSFLSMIRDATMGLFDVIIVHKLDRFSRDRYDFAYYKRALKKAGVRLISVTERLDDSPESVMMESLLEGMAEYYSRNLAREVMVKGLIPNARMCKHNGGIPPVGYKVNNDGFYEIDENEAEHVRLIFEMYARGDSYGKIVAELNRRGWMTRRGNPYSKTTLIGILRNEKYTGTYIYNRAISKSPDGKRNNWRSKPDDEIIRIPGGMPAIISQETWELVSQRIVANRNKGARNKARRNYLLSGKIFCGKCGSPFVGNTMRMRGHEYAYYECSAKKRRRDCQIRGIRADFIEEKVLERLYNELFAPKRIEKAAEEIIQYMQSRNSDLPARIAELRQQMLKNKREINNIVDAIASGLNSDSLRVRLLFLERVKDDIQSRLDDAIQKSNEISYTHEQVISFLQSFQDIMSAPFEKQRRAVEIFIDRVYIYDDIFYIDILNPLSHKERSKKNQTGENGNFGFEQSRSVSTSEIQNDLYYKRFAMKLNTY